MSEKKEPDMVAMMSKLLKRQAASDFDIDIFAGDPVGYHYFTAAFNEVVVKNIDKIHSGQTNKIDKTYWWSTKGDDKTFYPATSSCRLQECNITSWGKVREPHQILADYHKKTQSSINCIIFWDFLMFYQTFHSP